MPDLKRTQTEPTKTDSDDGWVRYRLTGGMGDEFGWVPVSEATRQTRALKRRERGAELDPPGCHARSSSGGGTDDLIHRRRHPFSG